jgi:hypothetical protein
MIGEGRMEREKVSTFAAKFKKASSEGLLNELGKGTRYCHRVRQHLLELTEAGASFVIRAPRA